MRLNGPSSRDRPHLADVCHVTRKLDEHDECYNDDDVCDNEGIYHIIMQSLPMCAARLAIQSPECRAPGCALAAVTKATTAAATAATTREVVQRRRCGGNARIARTRARVRAHPRQ
ncbi:hypothetical protein NP493_1015g00002 [Ridgeia piscesae]|uniref:Uncharacterized protein n=1 Tax=Ridgeia piscesae TaxID=27915 RepID=A0AAD9KIS1_RIDPI|nr:hypothetical protein NP493_1015g00002 [Ridgeia piscesae]